MRLIVCVMTVVRDVALRALVAALAYALMAAGALAQDPIPGSLHTPGFANGNFPIGSSHDVARAVALQPDGKIVLAGSCEYGGSNVDICVARDDGRFKQVPVTVQANANILVTRRILHALESNEPYLFVDSLLVRAQVPPGYKPPPGFEPEMFIQFEVSGFAIPGGGT